jgi:hypothetical protein
MATFWLGLLSRVFFIYALPSSLFVLLDPGSGMEKSVSGTNIPDLQHYAFKAFLNF